MLQPRIQLEDTTADAIVKMAEGNPGAISTMMEIITHHDEIDPQAAMGGLGAILMLDTWGIYGSNIYVLYNDKCSRDVRKLLMLMRATQLGFFPESRLIELSQDQRCEINISKDEWIDLDSKVCDRLIEFKKAG